MLAAARSLSKGASSTARAKSFRILESCTARGQGLSPGGVAEVIREHGTMRGVADRDLQNQSALVAVELMTASLESTESAGPQLLQERVVDLVMRGNRSEVENAIGLVIGLVNVCGSLIQTRESEQGVPRQDTMRELGMFFTLRPGQESG